ncbi:chromosome segregation DNA-binding protein [Cribrihabitans marinus]|uniref:Chromosome segregation DNA-binding protein n=1 Tax=Cribrihabitans marinus TaxID=1227549 RepID=A0A1H6YEU5_9RHOB|nr:ParB/RepB/Spo0J family partition protein [Cribrihabitans marinus]GGH29110.1 chromosome segregation DNA-binding protein [Cribrihabitans marinus]SEJ39803.1 chromosome segregation DNA-binding protein [Cribrihabitans marinus]
MSTEKYKSRGLGRGLSALMADVNHPADETPAQSRRPDTLVPIEQLKPNPNQPRRRFASENLEELSASIKEKGILQPLIVRRTGDDAYEIVAGERRWRAAQLAQLHEIPVLVRDFNDTEVLEVAIIENIQRADLNAVEEAAGYQQLMEKFGHTQEKMAEALGKSRSHIANLLRLLTLPEDVKSLVADGKLSAGHARALVTAENPSELARAVVRGGLSVRATEALVRKQSQTDTDVADKPKQAAKKEKDADTRALERDLSAILAMKVVIHHKPGSEAGQVVLAYENLDQLDDLCAKLSR